MRECLPYRPASQGYRRSAVLSETKSRVVPGISVTMARSCSSRRLNRLLLPTFGRPAMASVKPSNTRLAARETVDDRPQAVSQPCASRAQDLLGEAQR